MGRPRPRRRRHRDNPRRLIQLILYASYRSFHFIPLVLFCQSCALCGEMAGYTSDLACRAMRLPAVPCPFTSFSVTCFRSPMIPSPLNNNEPGLTTLACKIRQDGCRNWSMKERRLQVGRELGFGKMPTSSPPHFVAHASAIDGF